MKKQSQKMNDRRDSKGKGIESLEVNEPLNGQARQSGGKPAPMKKTPRAIQKTSKKPTVANGSAVGRFIDKARQFFREAKVELKKVKWPTRKELLASTAVVIVLTLLLAFFLGLVDFGLIKIIRNVVG